MHSKIYISESVLLVLLAKLRQLRLQVGELLAEDEDVLWQLIEETA